MTGWEGHTSDGSGSGRRGARGAPRRLRVYVLDDHEVARIGLRSALEAGGLEVVGESGSAREAQRLIPAFRPEVALLARVLADGSGIEVCRRIRSVDPGICCIILDGSRDDHASREARLAGAAGYLTKDLGPDELLAAVRRAGEGGALFDPGTGPWGTGGSDELHGLDPLPGRLSGQQRRILDLIGQGLTNRQIAHETGPSEKTVKNYVTVVLGELGLHNRTQAALFALSALGSPEARTRA